MKIIDFERKGNVVRFYLGKDSLQDWYGDDWNDCPYEHNAGTVYDEYVAGHVDIAFPFDDLVLEPSCGYHPNSEYCKDDMKARRVPCIIVVPGRLADGGWDDNFDRWAGADGIRRFHFGDRMKLADGQGEF